MTMQASKSHIAAIGRTGPDRPARGSGSTRPGSADRARPVNEVLKDLSEVRGRYEDLRAAEEGRPEVVELRSRLHELRAEAATARSIGATP